VTADHRSVHSNIPGVPWWGAVLIAITATAIGFAFDAGSGAKELTLVFTASYVVGCVIAVLAVRHSGIFSAVIQPPLVLFVGVPGAYFLFHGATFTSVKDILINCGYPLIERFPLMFFTSAAVLLIGMARWYLGMSARRVAATKTEAKDPAGRLNTVASKMSAMLTREPEDDVDATEAPRRRHSIERPGRSAKPAAAKKARAGRPGKPATPSRSRHTRPPETEIIEPVVDRPRRPRPARQVEPPPPAEPRRRSRTPSSRESAASKPPPDRRRSYERPDRHSRFEDYEHSESPGRNGTNGSNGSNGTHHPVSRVRYRGAAEDGDGPAEYRTRPRAARSREPESWDYDI
jgi:hypothetical protein